MGVYTDILALAQTFDTGGADEISIGIDRIITEEIEQLNAKQGDLAYPTGYSSANEVQAVAKHVGTVTGGNFTLAFSLWDGTEFETANIVHDANAVTIEAAIDTAAASVPNWTDEDITVAGGPLTTNAITLTYDGDSVTIANHAEVVIDGSDLSGGGSAGATSTSVEGQSDRIAWAVLKHAGVISGTPPTQGTISTVTAVSRESNPHMPSQVTLRALAKEASVQDESTAVEVELLRAMGLR